MHPGSQAVPERGIGLSRHADEDPSDHRGETERLDPVEDRGPHVFPRAEPDVG